MTTKQHLARLEEKLDRLTRLVSLLIGLETLMAGELDALTSQVAANTDAEQSAILLLTKLHELLVAAGTDPAKLASLTAQLASSKDALAAAVVANTPAAPAPPVTPPA